jgi:hypothetical protein
VTAVPHAPERLTTRMASVLADLQSEERTAFRLCEAGRRMLDAAAPPTSVTSSSVARWPR